MNNRQYFVIAINPAGIGTTGIVTKTFNGFYPWKWSKTITATNPVDAANEIINYINFVKDKMDLKDYSLKEVIVELPDGDEKDKEIKATRELVGILRFHYENKFKGHLLNQKDKDLLELKSKYQNSYLQEAEAIMIAHFKEKEQGWSCENAWWRKMNLQNKG